MICYKIKSKEHLKLVLKDLEQNNVNLKWHSGHKPTKWAPGYI